MLCAYCFPTNGEPFLWGVKTLATRLLWADLVPCGVAVNGEALPRGVPRGVNIFCFVIPDIFFKNVISFCFPRSSKPVSLAMWKRKIWVNETLDKNVKRKFQRM